MFESVLAVKPSKPVDFVERLEAVATFRNMEQAESLAAANKRIANILRKNDVERAIMTEELGRKFLDVDCIYIKDLGNYEEYFANE